MKPIYLGFDKNFTNGISLLLRIIVVALFFMFVYLTYLTYIYLANTRYVIFSYLLIGVLLLAGIFITLLITIGKKLKN